MLELAVLLSGIFANAVTAALKPNKNYAEGLSREDLAARATLVRGINLVLGTLALLASSWLMGEPLDLATVGGNIEAVFTIIITFAFSQGTYYLTKKKV